MARQVHIQYQISQQDLQPPPSHVFLPSAPMGALRAFQTGRQSLARGTAEREHIDSEARASANRYLRQGESEGTVLPLLQQLAQLTGGSNKPLVPHIRPDQLCVCNAGVPLQQQARVQNLQTFMDRDQQRRQQQPAALTVTVDALADSIAGQQPASLSGTVQLQGVTPPPVDSTTDNRMDTGATEQEPGQGDFEMGDGDGAQDSEKEVTEET